MNEWLASFLCTVIIAMLVAYFIRENQLRKEQMIINKELADAIKKLAEVVRRMQNEN